MLSVRYEHHLHIKSKAIPVTMKKNVIWDIRPCGSCKNRRFGGTWRLLCLLRSIRRLLVASCVVPCVPILVTLMKEAPGSSETSVLERATRRNIPEDTFLHSHRSENLKSYISVTGRGNMCMFHVKYEHHLHIKSKAIPVTGRGGL
jgi:hypothetical protein